MSKSGFTLIELMVAMVVGLTAITSVYTLGAAMSKQFYEEQRVATSQGTSRTAILELRRDISRAGLFGSPNGSLEPTCDATPAELPLLGGGNGPMGAFQYYADEDLAVLDPDGVNPDVHADRLRVLTSLYLTDQLLVQSASADGSVIVLQSGNQAYRRTFAWGQTAGPFTSGTAPTYLDGALDWDGAWAAETESWKGIAQKGARAFQTGSVLHIETPEGRHFFRSVFGKAGNTQNEVRIQIDPVLPMGTACLPGAAESSTVAPLQWVEYAIVDPFDAAAVGADFMDFDGMFYIDLSDTSSPSYQLQNTSASDLLESPNRVLVRRIIDSRTGNVRPSSTQVLAEFVSNFQVSFLLDTNSGTTLPPALSSEPITGATAETAVNADPQQVRTVIIELGIRNPLEDPDIPFQADGGTRFEVNKDQTGSARVRHMRIEIPVMDVARRNL
ncbi:MAG TPA: prepilin-type N-terminal cleavage/methylation domain-containing protein [Polyangiales bacterium]|nr:prepilin-type N-terminal cleavage/methylation domain-containing protein [Polyangiales bacterium]